MKLIGMLDSPYVRRVAICLKLLKLDFEHQSISVFSTYDEFKKINPVVKAPTLVLDDGQRVMDSTAIPVRRHARRRGPADLPVAAGALEARSAPDGAGSGRLREVGADRLRTQSASGREAA